MVPGSRVPGINDFFEVPQYLFQNPSTQIYYYLNYLLLQILSFMFIVLQIVHKAQLEKNLWSGNWCLVLSFPSQLMRMRVSLIPQEFNVIICIVYNDRLSTIKKILLLELDWLLFFCCATCCCYCTLLLLQQAPTCFITPLLGGIHFQQIKHGTIT